MESTLYCFSGTKFAHVECCIRYGDFIVAFNGVSGESSDDLFKMLTEEKIGIFQDVTVIRHDKKIDLRVTTMEARMRA